MYREGANHTNGLAFDVKGNLDAVSRYKNLPSTEAIEEPIRERGGDLDGSTMDTRTESTVSGLRRRDFELGLKIPAELMMVPLIREEDVAIEKGLVSQNEYPEAAADPEQAGGAARFTELLKITLVAMMC